MGMELICVETLETQQHAAVAQQFDPKTQFRYMQRDALRKLADEILQKMTRYEKIEPTTEEIWEDAFSPIRHRWSIGIETNKSELAARAKQMADSQAEGRLQAIAVISKHIKAFEKTDGICTQVILSALGTVCQAIRDIPAMRCEELPTKKEPDNP